MTNATEHGFRNPLLGQGQDPSAVFHEGAYYLVQSNDGKLTIARSTTLTGLGAAEPVTVFVPPPGQPYSYDMWAPELVRLRDRWYIYVAATSAPGANPTHRMFVLQADTDDPLGSWTVMGKLTDSTDKWAIDGVVFEYKGQIYTVWSGWPGDIGDFPQNLYIAAMSDPWTISSERTLIAEPDQPWETSVAALLEGPEAFIHNGQLSIVYSGNASWTRHYTMGLLKLVGDNPLDRDDWEKIGPVFTGREDKDGIVYGVGHNSMPVTSPDGTEYWLLYHVKTVATNGWVDRAIHAQPFTWNVDGTPNFGRAVASTEVIPLPSGER
jgi:GH43 family beta-xylosidase